MKKHKYNIFKGILLTLLSITLLSCSTKKKVESTGIHSIIFGQQGGFSGLKKSQSLSLLTKQITLSNGDTKKVKNKDIKVCIDLLEELDYKNVEINKPYNMNRFIEITSKDSSKKFIWGDPSFSPPAVLNSLYTHLLQLAKK